MGRKPEVCVKDRALCTFSNNFSLSLFLSLSLSPNVSWLFVEEELLAKGFPAYTTSCGWLGYSDEKIKKVLSE